MRLAALLAAAWLAAPAAAAPCDSLADALAYNACLARQGPAARAVRLGAAPAPSHARPVPVRTRGRVEMVFSPR